MAHHAEVIARADQFVGVDLRHQQAALAPQGTGQHIGQRADDEATAIDQRALGGLVFERHQSVDWGIGWILMGARKPLRRFIYEAVITIVCAGDQQLVETSSITAPPYPWTEPHDWKIGTVRYPVADSTSP